MPGEKKKIDEYNHVRIIESGIIGTVIDIFEKNGLTLYTVESNKRGIENGGRDEDDYGRFVCTDEEIEPLMRVKYVGNWDTLPLIKGKEYSVMSVEKGWYRIYTELDENYLFPPKLFEIVNRETGQND